MADEAAVVGADRMSQCFDMDGYGFPFYRVTHYYPTEETNGVFQWGYKIDNGVFEFFPHSTKEAAEAEHDRFIAEFNTWLLAKGGL